MHVHSTRDVGAVANLREINVYAPHEAQFDRLTARATGACAKHSAGPAEIRRSI
jgi:hypothetical protein